MSFTEQFNHAYIDDLRAYSAQATRRDVHHALNQPHGSIQDFAALLSPAATSMLESLAQRARAITVQRTGHVMSVYIPMYLSNVCQNNCVYCGFSVKHQYTRKTLSPAEISADFNVISEKGFRHILLLTGESRSAASPDFIRTAVSQASRQFASVGLEVYPLETAEYQSMVTAGADSLTIYQETYDKPRYLDYHPTGKKRNFEYRLDTPDRAGQAGFHKLNLGALLGLTDWRFDALALCQHLKYLEKTYWGSKLGVSMPRIQDIIGGYLPPFPVSDIDLAQFICAFRITFPDLTITLSTREPAQLRDHLIKLGITNLSAESHTNPGGYSGSATEQQFEISDSRTLPEIKAMLAAQGYEVVMKDWDRSFIH